MNNQKGFSVFLIIVVLAIILVLGLSVYLIFFRGDNSSSPLGILRSENNSSTNNKTGFLGLGESNTSGALGLKFLEGSFFTDPKYKDQIKFPDTIEFSNKDSVPYECSNIMVGNGAEGFVPTNRVLNDIPEKSEIPNAPSKPLDAKAVDLATRLTQSYINGSFPYHAPIPMFDYKELPIVQVVQYCEVGDNPYLILGTVLGYKYDEDRQSSRTWFSSLTPMSDETHQLIFNRLRKTSSSYVVYGPESIKLFNSLSSGELTNKYNTRDVMGVSLPDPEIGTFRAPEMYRQNFEGVVKATNDYILISIDDPYLGMVYDAWSKARIYKYTNLNFKKPTSAAPDIRSLLVCQAVPATIYPDENPEIVCY